MTKEEIEKRLRRLEHLFYRFAGGIESAVKISDYHSFDRLQEDIHKDLEKLGK